MVVVFVGIILFLFVFIWSIQYSWWFFLIKHFGSYNTFSYCCVVILYTYTHTSCSTLWYCFISNDHCHQLHYCLHVLGACCMCSQNIEITRYALIYGPSSDSSVRSGIFVMDINTNNVYTITGLLPRTGYTIQVRADHATVFGTLEGTISATGNAETAVPEGGV